MHKKPTIYIFVAGLILSYLFYIKIIPENDRNEINLMSVFGTYLSVFGLIIAYIQILSIKQETIKTRSAIKSSLDQVRRVLSISELSKTKKLIEEIQQYLQNDKFDASSLRMHDLKENLIQNKYISHLTKQTEAKSYRDLIANVGIDINTLHDKISSPVSVIDKSIIMQNLEKVKSAILEFENILKYVHHEQ